MAGAESPKDAEAPPTTGPAATIEELFGTLGDLTAVGAGSDTEAEAQDVRRLIAEAHHRGLIDSRLRTLGLPDVAEALAGSVVFVTPLLIEDGVFDVATHLRTATVAEIPIFFVANVLFVIGLTYALLEWTGRNRDETWLLAGVVPARLVMTLGVSAVVAVVLLTAWGRAGGWATPSQALSRAVVLWTVAAIGAGLGDAIATDDTAPVAADIDRTAAVGAAGKSTTAGARQITALSDGELVAALHRELDDLEATLSDAADRTAVSRLRTRATAATIDETFGDRIESYTARDLAEAFVGSVVFAVPFLVEDGVFAVATHLQAGVVSRIPVLLLANAGFVLGMILALVYWAGPQDVKISRPLLGFIPRRLLGIALVSACTAAVLLLLWGRIGTWQTLGTAIARISVVWPLAAFGAALGDVLPGESSGPDLGV